MRYLSSFTIIGSVFMLSSCASATKSEYPFFGKWKLSETRCLDKSGTVLKKRAVGDSTKLVISSNYFLETNSITKCKLSVSGKTAVSGANGKWKVKWLADPTTEKRCAGVALAKGSESEASGIIMRGGALVEQKEKFGSCATLEKIYLPDS